MTAKTVFRLLVLASVILGLGAILISSFPGAVPEDWKPALDKSGSGAFYERFISSEEAIAEEEASTPHLDESTRTAVAGIAGLVIALILLAALLLYIWLGLFFFWRHARTLNVIVYTLTLVATHGWVSRCCSPWSPC